MSGEITSSVPLVEVEITAAQMTEWMRVLVGDEIAELRALNVPQRYRNPKTEFGFFDADHLDETAAAAIELSNCGASGVYFTLNPVHRDLLARSANRTRIAGTGDTTSDAHIIRRRWLLIDADPKRVSGVPQPTMKRRRLCAQSNPSKHILQSGGGPSRSWRTPVTDTISFTGSTCRQQTEA